MEEQILNKETNMMEQAMIYLGMDFSVIPIAANKIPLVSWELYQKRRPTEEKVREWFITNHNIAIITGEISNLTVVDIDPRNGGTNDFLKDIKTPYSKTGGGGYHYYFKYLKGSNCRAGIRPGVDIKSSGGYVLAPPSMHKSGNRYKWIVDPLDCEFAQVPEFLAKEILFNNESNGEFNSKFDFTKLEGVSEGSRNESAASVIGHLLAALPEKEWTTTAWSLFLGWNKNNNPPLSEKELKTTFKSIAQKEKGKGITKIPITIESLSTAENRVFHPALTLDRENQEIIASFSKNQISVEKEKVRLEEILVVVQSNGDIWDLTKDNMIAKKMFASVVPVYGYSEERYSQDLLYTLKNEAKCVHGVQCESLRGGYIDAYKDVFSPLNETFKEYIDFPNPIYSSLITLWVMGTYVFPIFDCYPYLYLGGMRGSGKSKILDILYRTCFNPELSANASPSSLFRIVERNLSTILLDEGESLTGREANPELRLLLQAGYKKATGIVTRTQPDSLKTERFRVYSPKAIASINPLDPTLAERCISVIMLKTSDSKKGTKRINDRSSDWMSLRHGLYKFLFSYGLCIAERFENSEHLQILTNRNDELYLPLFVLAEFVDLFINDEENKILPAIQGFAKELLNEEFAIDDWTLWVIQALDAVVDEKREYLLKEIKQVIAKQRVDEGESLNEKFTNNWLGNCLRKLGLKRGSRKREGWSYWIKKNQVEEIKNRYSLPPFNDSHSTQATQNEAE